VWGGGWGARDSGCAKRQKMCDFATDATGDAALEGHHVSTTPADAQNVGIGDNDTAENCTTLSELSQAQVDR
jgi:hypothetical protein